MGYYFKQMDYHNIGKDFLNCIAIFASQKKHQNMQEEIFKSQAKKPNFNWKLISQRINNFELKKQIKSLSKEICRVDSEQEQKDKETKSQLDEHQPDKDNNMIFLKCLFSKKFEMPISVQEQY